MNSYFSTIRPRNVLGFGTAAVAMYIAYSKYSMHQLDIHPQPKNKQNNKSKQQQTTQSMQSQRSVGVNAKFIKQLKTLLPIMIPSIYSKESFLMLCLCTILFARTWLDVWFSSLNSVVVKSIVSRNKRAFLVHAISEFGAMMWVLSITNNSLKLIISNLSLAFRKRLSRAAHDAYFKKITFFTCSTIDQRLVNIDQLITQDIEKLSESAARLISDTLKPIVDIALFGFKLSQAIGKEAPMFMISYFAFSGLFLRSISPPFGRYTSESAKLEGDLRFMHSRVVAHGEEIAFYNGGDREKGVVNASFDEIVVHASRLINLKFANGIVDSVFVKYLATMLAYYLLARPVFDPQLASPLMGGGPDVDPTKIMSDYSRNSSYLVNLSQAIGRVILAGRDLTRFAGFTSRVADLFDVLSDINNGQYEARMLNTASATTITGKGDIRIISDVIEFDKVPIITPNGDTLVRELSFRVEVGQNTLITGPNGCGKSSLFRLLSDLWPLFGGTITKPASNQLFYVPQKPYLAIGTLRDQIIYPYTQQTSNVDDRVLNDLLKIVQLDYLVLRDGGGFDAVQDWGSALSGGEKQRLAMARMFYARPQFAILDECTSAVSVDVEGFMYTHAKSLGITLFTVSHRTSLFKYHDFLLQFDGFGRYTFAHMDHGDPLHPFSFQHQQV